MEDAVRLSFEGAIPREASSHEYSADWHLGVHDRAESVLSPDGDAPSRSDVRDVLCELIYAEDRRDWAIYDASQRLLRENKELTAVRNEFLRNSKLRPGKLSVAVPDADALQRRVSRATRPADG